MTAPAAARDQRLSVNETFLSFQGEGPSAGERAVFLRLAGCNLACSWCDTPYSWDWTRHDRDTNSRSATPTDTAADIARLAGPHCRLLVLTGGEPLIQQRAAARTLTELRAVRPGMRCEVETNGTIAPTPDLARLVHRYVVSPKLSHSGISKAARLRHATLRDFADCEAVLKFVVGDARDVAEAAAIAEAAAFTADRVWIMPLGTDPDGTLGLARHLSETILRSGFNLSLRQHLLLWGDQRGR